MGIAINGSGTVSGIAVGGLPDGIIQTADMASGVLYQPTGSLRVLERFYSPCDGSVMPTSKGNVTLGNVTAFQDLTTTVTQITGSSITYEPPAGTVQIIYEFVFFTAFYNANPIATMHLYLDGVEVTSAIRGYGGEDTEDNFNFKWGFNIGGTANAATGRVASWSGTKTIELKIRDWLSNANQGYIHTTQYTDGVNTNTFVMPCIGITAIGTDS